LSEMIVTPAIERHEWLEGSLKLLDDQVP
jgi:hypothetical protein